MSRLKVLLLYMALQEQKNNPLHGRTLEFIITQLQEKYGWAELGYLLRFECFIKEPSIKSSLKFLRKHDWARKKVEKLYLDSFG